MILPIDIDQEEGVWHGREESTAALFGHAQGLLASHTFGDVADGCQVNGAALPLESSGTDLDGDDRSISPSVLPYGHVGRRRGAHGPRLVLLRRDVDISHGEKLFVGIAVELLRRRVRVEDSSTLRVDEEERIGLGVPELAVLLLALAQRVLDSVPLRSVVDHGEEVALAAMFDELQPDLDQGSESRRSVDGGCRTPTDARGPRAAG